MLPDIYIYNPTCEIAIANGTVNYMPNQTLRQFEKDLATLPMFFAEPKDIVLVHELPDPQFLQEIDRMGAPLPHFRVMEEALSNEDFVSMPKGMLRPWGWSPAVHHQLASLKPSCSEEFHQLHSSRWSDDQKEIYSRITARSVLLELLEVTPMPHFMQVNSIPQVCHSIEEVERQFDQWPQIILKAPWSSSGRGIQVLRHGELNQSVIQWTKGILQQQGYVMVEPLLDKVLDFATEFEIQPNGNIKYLGPSFFTTNSNGKYESNCVGGFPNEAGTQIRSFLTGELIDELALLQKSILQNSSIAGKYTGYLGIDALVYRDENGNFRIHPCVEINLRYNMGVLALQLNKFLHPDAKGNFHIYFEKGKSFSEFHQEMKKKHPFRMEEGKWRNGYVPLVSPYSPKAFGAYIRLR